MARARSIFISSSAFLLFRSFGHKQMLDSVGCGTDYSTPSTAAHLTDVEQMWFATYAFTCHTRGTAFWAKFTPDPYVQITIALPELERFGDRRGEVLLLAKGLAGNSADLNDDTIPPEVLTQAQEVLTGNADWGWERLSSPDDQSTCGHISPSLVQAIEAVPQSSLTTKTGRCRVEEGDHLYWWPVVDKYHEAPGVEHLAAFWLRDVGATKPATGKMEVWLGKNVDKEESEQGLMEVLCPLYPKDVKEVFKTFYELDLKQREPVSPCSASTETVDPMSSATYGADGGTSEASDVNSSQGTIAQVSKGIVIKYFIMHLMLSALLSN